MSDDRGRLPASEHPGEPRMGEEPVMNPARWLDAARADVERRGLPDVVPVLEGLAHIIAVLRAADWNDSAAGSAAPHARPPASD